ncbi:MAG: sulfurtransferase [Ignavibacteriales bacterium]|nr:MAG: sulfurtransferase [Ignavibacteriales bacterium]
MGPLVPDIISNELNFIVALLIGIAFGFILEQAGFSTSKKLVGLFYGYDFTVLRVFFTAGVTAMIGVIALGHFGMLDINLVYINPTFLWSALIGGFIMGLGFVVGGFCPGTSFCAAAIGKIDAMIFIAGSFIGVLIFAEGYPLFEDLYKAEYWGYVRIFDTVGLSQGLFAFLLMAVAVGAFWFTTLIENKVNGKPNPEFRPKRLYAGLTGVALLLGLSAFLMPDIREVYLEDIENESYVISYEIKFMTSDELAFRIMDDDRSLQIIDVRSNEEFKKFNLPKSFSYSLNELFNKDAERFLTVNKKKNIFLADDELTAKRAAIIADKLGYVNPVFLKGGLDQFRKEILEFQKPEVINTRREIDTYRFRKRASKEIPVLIEQNKNKIIPKKESKRVIGGC